MSKKLKNVKAVREMIAGTHKTQTKTNVSFGEKKPSSKEKLVKDGQMTMVLFGNKEKVTKLNLVNFLS